MINPPINLIPPQRLQARRLRRRRVGWIVGLSAHAALVLSACVAARQIWPGANSAVAAELTETRQRISQLNSQLSQQRRAAIEVAARRSFIDTIANKPDWSLLLKLIDSNVGDDIVLRDCQLQPAATRGQLNFTMNGMAETPSKVTQFVARLQQTGLFQDLKIARSERQPFGNTTGICFQLNCTMDNSVGALP